MSHSRRIVPSSTGTGGALARDEEFYVAFITFRVGDLLFRVPRKPFEEKSTAFSDMFKLPQSGPGNDSYNVCSDEDPLRLVGIDQQDFRSFLKVLLRNESPAKLNMSINEWIGALRLATMWDFDAERRKSIDVLDELLDEGALIRKLSIAREFGIQQWLQPICEELTTRTATLAPDQARQLDLGFLDSIHLAREAHLKSILYHIVTKYLQPVCFCGGDLSADRRAVVRSPEWYFQCDSDACKREFTIGDAIRMSPHISKTDIQEDLGQIANSMLVQRLMKSSI
ncbi:hypothetical protein SCHPADRAFT_504805 [Schizopora paradoxa]|uniref:BTB domain-containing protein n=1 Tax=Schizopora paradoxa TaxID=27342 RepID=A0A0H2RMS3_9AGAM|nr:hypothetical protein SCHPADRAFT_504805 [Schizopora paradoxa]